MHVCAADSALAPLLPGLPPDTAVTSRCDEANEYLFVQHYSPGPVNVPVPEDAEVLPGHPDGAMEGWSVMVLQRPLREA